MPISGGRNTQKHAGRWALFFHSPLWGESKPRSGFGGGHYQSTPHKQTPRPKPARYATFVYPKGTIPMPISGGRNTQKHARRWALFFHFPLRGE